MSATIATRQWIQLRLADPGLAGVTVNSDDDDVAALSRQMISSSGHIATRSEAFEPQLHELSRELKSWSASQSEVVEDVFLVLKEAGFLFLVILKGTTYNGTFEDDLTDLDIKIAQDPDYDLIKLSVLALPAFAEDAIRSFLPLRDEPESGDGDAERAEPPIDGKS